MAVITKTELENAKRDADDLGLIVNGAADLNGDGMVETRTGGDAPTVKKMLSLIPATGRLGYATWAELDAIDTAGRLGSLAEIPLSDAGTHTDPVVGGVVDNSGVYRAEADGWQRIYDTDAASAQPYADAAAASAAAASTSATDAATAAGSIYVTSYVHEYSVGDRTGITGLLFTTALTIGAGTISNLIDGGVTANSTDGVSFTGSQAITGLAVWQMIYPNGRSIICNEVKIKNSTNAAAGNVQVQLLRHDGTWVNYGAATSMGGATTVTITFANTIGHAGVRIVGTSGTTASSGWVLEVELKLANGPQDGMGRLPPSPGLPGDRAAVGDFPYRENVYSPRYGIMPVHAGVNRLALYMMDDERGGGMIKNRLEDRYHFDFRTDRGTYGPAPKKSAKGWLFRKNMVRMQENITGVRTIAVMIRKQRGNSTCYEISTSLAGELMYLRGSDFRAATTIRVLAPNGEMMPIFGDTSGSNVAGGTFMNRGGWHLAFIETAAALGAARFGLGGDPDLTANTLHAVMMESAYLSLFDGQMTDDMCKAEAEWLCPIMKRERGITLRNEETTRMVDILLMWGQSNIGGDAPLWDTPKQLLSMKNIPQVKIMSANRKDRAWMSYPCSYDAGTTSLMGALQTSVANTVNYQLPNPNANYEQHNDRKYGPDWQIARLHALSVGRARELYIAKVGADGTILGAPTEGGGGSTSWHPLTAWNTGVLGHALTRLYEMWFHLLEQGIGFDIVAAWFGQGETTVNIATNALQTTNWGTNFLDMRSTARTYTANMIPALWLITRLRAYEAGFTGDATKTAQLRVIQDGLATADPTNIKVLSADGFGPDVWGRTIGFHPEVGGQLLHYNGALLDQLGTAADALIPFSTY